MFEYHTYCRLMASTKFNHFIIMMTIIIVYSIVYISIAYVFCVFILRDAIRLFK